MNGPALVEAVAARLRAEVPDWPLYEHGLPDGDLPGRYLVVRGAEGVDERTRAVGSTTVQSPSVWVASSVRHPDGQFAAKEAGRGAARVRSVLRDWRPEGRWALRPSGSTPAERNDALPDTTYSAVEQLTLRSTI